MESTRPLWPALDSRYAVARDALVEAEHDVSRAVEALAALRRGLPEGSLVRNYEFVEGPRDIRAGDQSHLRRSMPSAHTVGVVAGPTSASCPTPTARTPETAGASLRPAT